MMELYIETLTGTAFELRVSPYETVQDVKARIQKLEGIPMSQQHLIWQSVELEDDFSLQDYSIHDGATLKLVLTMRGGPINTRRIPVDEPTLRDMAEYYFSEANREDLMEKVPGNRPMTVIVYHNGDQLNFFRVVDRDSTSPLSESLSGASVYNLCDEEEEEEEDGDGSSKEESLENSKTREKMRTLKLKMENLSLNKKPKKKVPNPRPPSSGRPGSKTKVRRFHPSLAGHRSGHLGPGASLAGSLNPNACLPPLGHSATPNSGTAATAAATPLAQPVASAMDSAKLTTDTPTSKVAMPDKTEVKQEQEAEKETNEDLPTSSCKVDNEGGLVPSPPKEKPPPTTENDILESLIRRAQSHRTPLRKWEFSQELLLKGSSEAPHPPASPRKKEVLKESLSLRPTTSTTNALECVLEDTSCDSAGPGRPSTSSRNKDLSLEAFKESLGRPPTSSKKVTGDRKQPGVILESLHPSEVRDLSGMLSSIVRSASKSRASYTLSGGTLKEVTRIPTPEAKLRQSARLQRLSAGRDGRVSPPHRLPPVKQKKKSAKRCYFCGKKTGLATSYQCRCGNNFCATHRYAEVHSCSFDYKTEGRKILEQSNPVVTAPKLPKI